MLLVLGLNIYNITIPIISQLIGFIYLTFIPGYLILRILKIHQIGSTKSLLFAVGLSLLSVMFVGFATNMIIPMVGISNPISFSPILVVMVFYVVILCILSFIIDKEFNAPTVINTTDIISPVFLYLCLIPFLAIFGSYIMNLYHNNIITMFLLAIIALTFVLVVFDKIPKKLYLFTIWIISISLVYMSSLISPYVWGWDIQNEYYLANLVLIYSKWNYMLPDAYNSMLSIVMIGPIYSMLTHLNLDYVLKIIIPFIFSLIPLGLYMIFKTQIQESKITFMAVFLFISFNTFYIELLSLTREMIAELFLVLLLLLFINRNLKPNLVILMFLFSMGLVVSHYSTAYFFIALLVGVTLMLGVFNLTHFNISRNKIDFKGNKTLLFVLPSITLFMIIFAYIWYSSFSQGTAINSIIDVATYIKQDFVDTLNLSIQSIGIVPGPIIYALLTFLMIIFILIILYIIKLLQKRFQSGEHHWTASIQALIKDKMSKKMVAAIGIIVLLIFTLFLGQKSWIVMVLRYMNFLLVFFTLMGMFLVFLRIYKNRFQNIYLAFSVVGVVVLIAGFIVPSFESSFNISRIYQLSFIILSPLCVVGGMEVLGSIYDVLTRQRIDEKGYMKIFAIFLLIFMLFNTGFISVLGNESIPMHLSNENRLSDYYPLFDLEEETGAEWLIDYRASWNVYTDVYGKFIFYRFTPNFNGISSNNGISEYTQYNNTHTYMYLRKLNTENGYLVGYSGRSDRNRLYEDLSSIVNLKNRIFDDGNSRVFYS